MTQKENNDKIYSTKNLKGDTITMKKISILLLSALLLITSFAFASCDQESVDNTLNNLMDASVEIFDPVFKKTESSLENDGNYDEDEGNENEAESTPSDSTEGNSKEDPNPSDSTGDDTTEQETDTSLEDNELI